MPCNMIIQRAQFSVAHTQNYLLPMCFLPRHSRSEWWFTFLPWALMPALLFPQFRALLWEWSYVNCLVITSILEVLSTYSIRKLRVTSLPSLPEYGKKEVTRSIPNAVYPVLISSEDFLMGHNVSLPVATYMGESRCGDRPLMKPWLWSWSASASGSGTKLVLRHKWVFKRNCNMDIEYWDPVGTSVTEVT